MKKIILLSLALLATSISFAQQKINDDSSEVTFSVTNMGVNVVEGWMGDLKGTVNFVPYDVEAASFDVTIDPSTVDTENGLRDKHLRNKKGFFYTKIFPEVRFVSKKVVESDDGRSYKVIGDLTIKETTKEIEIPFKFVEQDKGVQLTGTFELMRKEYDLGAKQGQAIIGEEVAIKIVCVIE